MDAQSEAEFMENMALFSSIRAEATGDRKQYEKDACLGSGTFARVFCGNNRTVAIKEMYRPLMMKTSTELLRNMLDEVHHLKQNPHPHIVKYIDSYIEEHKLHVVTELLTGFNLSTVADNYDLSDRHIAAVCKAVLHALYHLHGNNLIYRDLKGQNIMLEENGNLKLIDFGFCVKDDGHMTSLCGSADHVSPEMAHGKVYNGSGDIWALGITTLEFLNVGRPVYSRYESNSSILEQIKTHGRPPPIDNEHFLDPVVQDFVDKCLQVKTENRATAAQLLEHSFIATAATSEEMKQIYKGPTLTNKTDKTTEKSNRTEQPPQGKARAQPNKAKQPKQKKSTAPLC